MRIYEELKRWQDELRYFDANSTYHICPTPEGVTDYIGNLYNKIIVHIAMIAELKEEIQKLKITAERLKKGLTAKKNV